MDLKTVYADEQGNIVDAPKDFLPLIRQGVKVLPVEVEELIPLPKVADLMCLPEYKPMARYQGEDLPITGHTVSAILPEGYVNTALPAYEVEAGAEVLPAYPYGVVVAYKDELYTLAERLDSSYTNPFQQYNTRNLHKLVNNWQKKYPQNKLVSFMGDLALNDRLYKAQDLFYQRGEVVLPFTKTLLNLPNIQGGYYPLTKELAFNPSGAELAQVAVAHLQEDNLISFGLNPLEDLDNGKGRLLNAIGKIRSRVKKGKLNLFNLGLAKESIGELAGGLDSITFYVPAFQPGDYELIVGEAFSKLIATLDSLAEFKGKIIFKIPYIAGFTNSEANFAALQQLLTQYKIAGVVLVNPWLPQALLISLNEKNTTAVLKFKTYLAQLQALCPVAGDVYTVLAKEGKHDN